MSHIIFKIRCLKPLKYYITTKSFEFIVNFYNNYPYIPDNYALQCTKIQLTRLYVNSFLKINMQHNFYWLPFLVEEKDCGLAAVLHTKYWI